MSRDIRRNRAQGFATRAIHLGYDPAEHEGALTPPIYMISTYAFESAEQGAAIFRGEEPGYDGELPPPTRPSVKPMTLPEPTTVKIWAIMMRPQPEPVSSIWQRAGRG